MYQLVVINYFKNQVKPHAQQLLFVHQIGDQAALDEFDNTDIRVLIDGFIAHNFSLEPELVIYYYIQGLNDAQDPFYYGRVVDSLKSPYTRDVGLRFGDQTSSAARSKSSTASKSAVSDASLVDGSITSDSSNGVVSAPSSAVDLDRGEPDDVLDQLMRDHNELNLTRDGDQHGKK